MLVTYPLARGIFFVICFFTTDNNIIFALVNQTNTKVMLRFSDGVNVDTSGKLRKLKLVDGWYIVGNGSLIPVKDEEDAETKLAVDRITGADDTIKQLLKPCPICGESNDIAFHAPNKDNKEDVQCLKCGLKMEKALGNSMGAVAWWNKRT